MDPLVYPMGLLIFAFVAAEALRPEEGLEESAPARHPLPSVAEIDA